MVFGVATPVSDKLAALEAMSEAWLPGRWQTLRSPHTKELAATMVLLPIVLYASQLIYHAIVLDKAVRGITPATVADLGTLDAIPTSKLSSTIFRAVGYGTEVRKAEEGPQNPQPMSYPIIRRYADMPGQKLTPQILQRFRARLRFFPLWQQALAVFALASWFGRRWELLRDPHAAPGRDRSVTGGGQHDVPRIRRSHAHGRCPRSRRPSPGAWKE